MDYQNYYLMYNALTDVGQLPQVNIYPDLAKSWEISKDGREYIFPLREGVKFHHGKETGRGRCEVLHGAGHESGHPFAPGFWLPDGRFRPVSSTNTMSRSG